MADETTPATPPDDWADAPEFTTARKQQKIKVDGVRYIVQDMMGDELGEWMKYQASRLVDGKKGRPNIDKADFSEFNAKLISLCLYYAAPDGTPGGRVPIEVVKPWSAPVLNYLFDLCQRTNGLTEDGREEAKKA